MKKIFTLFAMVCLTALSAMAAITYVPDVKYTSLADLEGKTFAIVNEAEGKALYGSNAQNLAYDVYTSAFVETNSGYMWKAVKDDEANAYYLQLVTPAGADYNCWGMGGVLNSQGEPQGWACSFILGTNNQKGQDIPNGALYELAYTTNGWTMKNVGTGMYTQYSNGPANSTEPTYWTLCTLKEQGEEDPIPPLVEIEALKPFVANKTIFSLKSGDSYVYGSDQQNVAVGTWEQACAATNNATNYILEADEHYYYLRAVKADGSDISAWGTKPCYLNTTSGGIIFEMGKDQDMKNGSSWLIEEVSAGKYSIKNVAKNSYMAINGTQANLTADVVNTWEFYVPAEPVEYTVNSKVTVDDLSKKFDAQVIKVLEGNDGEMTVTLPAAQASVYTMDSQDVKVKLVDGVISMVADQKLNFKQGENTIVVTVTNVEGTFADDKINVTVTGSGDNGKTVTVIYSSDEIKDPQPQPITEARSWDFTNVYGSDAQAEMSEATEYWGNESKGRLFYLVKTADEELQGTNGALSVTEGLYFTVDASKLLIGATSTANPYLQIGGNGYKIRIPNCGKGDVIKVTMCCATKNKTTSLTSDNLEENITEVGTSKEEKTAVVAADGDLILTTGTDIRLYTIDITPYDPTAATAVSAAKQATAVAKFIENGKVVVVKNGKKYTAAGAEIK